MPSSFVLTTRTELEKLLIRTRNPKLGELSAEQDVPKHEALMAKSRVQLDEQK